MVTLSPEVMTVNWTSLDQANGTGLVWWDDLCGVRKRENAFWDTDAVFNTNSPDLTPCFQQTILVWFCCAILWVCAPCYISYLLGRQTVSTCRHKSLLNVIKIVCGLLIVVADMVSLGHVISEASSGYDVSLARYIAPSASAATTLLATWLFHVEFHKGVHASGVQFVYWTITALLGIIPLRTLLLKVDKEGNIDDVVGFTTALVVISLCIVQFLLQLIADSKAHLRPHSQYQEERQPLLAPQVPEPAEHTTRTLNIPDLKATSLSKSIFFWMTSLVIKGFRRTLVFEDLYDIKPENGTRAIAPKFESLMKPIYAKYQQLRNRENANNETPGEPEVDIKSAHAEPSIMRPFYSTCAWNLFLGIVVMIPSSAMQFLNPLLLNEFIGWIQSDDPYVWKGYFLAVLLLVTNVLLNVILQWNFIFCQIAGLRMRTLVSAAIYRKMLRMSSAARKKYTSGEVINMMSVDAEMIQMSTYFVAESIISPIVIIVALYVMWQFIGPSSLMCVAVIVILGFVGFAALGSLISKYQNEQMGHKDRRVKLISEIMNGIKVIKLYAWEKSFLRNIARVRSKEMNAILKKSYADSVFGVIWFCTPVLSSLGIFLVYILTSAEKTLDPQTAFVTLSLINLVNWPIASIPIALQSWIEAFVSIRRVRSFLLGDELDPKAVRQTTANGDAVMIESGTFSWEDGEDPTLKNIKLNIKEGDLVAIVGQVGSGKSSLVSAILGEMETIGGEVSLKGSVGYVPQLPWIQNKTLKENILFGERNNDSRYANTIEACALNPDFKMLPAGDRTEIGEKGINLSGGQKQRVSLARAVYLNKDIYLLDDPLSAVDAHVGKHIFEKVIGPNGVLKHKTRVLATHSVTYLPYVDNIIVLKNGCVSESGTFKELLEQDGAFAEFLQEYFSEEKEDVLDENPELQGVRKVLERQRSRVSDQSGGEEARASDGSMDERNSPRRRRNTVSQSSVNEPEKSKGQTEAAPQSGDLIEEETTEIGSVKWGVIGAYVKAGGVGLCSFALFWMVVFLITQSLTNIWLSNWSNDMPPKSAAEFTFVNVRIGVYAALGVGQGIAVFSMAMVLYIGSVRASKRLHNNLLNGIMRAPMSFFDTVPLGRIMNRFSTDMDTLDVQLPAWINQYMLSLTPVLCTFIIITYTTPWFLLVMVPMALFYIAIQRVYIRSVRQMKRIESIRRSPVYSHFGESLAGESSIRAYKVQDEFISKLDSLVDNNMVAQYSLAYVERWQSVMLSMVASAIIFFAALFAVIEKGRVTGGDAGLSVSYAIQSSFFFTMLIHSATELETMFVPVERVKEYSKVEREAPWTVEGNTPNEDWPASGSVEFAGYSTRYRPGLDLVLQDINCQIKPGEKVGIVGRTGAGKSSITLALFRIIEAAQGRIKIDDVNISNIGLQDLRAKLTIIPQDPVLFSGSLRSNLDPFEDYSDDAVWSVLEHAHLKEFVKNLSLGLEYEVGESGTGLSVGQRQLICLARALLRKSKVLILDEATAAVDMQTDELIQTTIRNSFHDCTVLTIAHRLNTVMDYDRVMVLNRGSISEFDSPNALLKDKSTLFYSMAQGAGLL